MIRNIKYTLFTVFILLNFISSFAQVKTVEFHRDIERDSIRYCVKNLLPAPMRFSLACDTINYSMDTILLPDSEFIEVITMPDLRETDSSSVGHLLKVSAKLGYENSRHDDDYQYRLPFKEGKRYEVLQPFKGKFSHRLPHSMYAIDFTMDIGEPVHAAREGIVCYYKKRFTEGGRDREKFMNKANEIMILHSDGTIGNYVHLNTEGVLCEIGDYVEKGQLIGYSGNTGFSTMPHLHFVVLNGDIAVPIKFEGYRKLKEGRKVEVK